MSSIADNATPTTHLLRSKQVSPLPVGPGGNNPTKRQMNDTNTQLTMLTSQGAADTKYDPPVPKPVTKAVTLEGFSVEMGSKMIAVVGALLIVYGIVTK